MNISTGKFTNLILTVIAVLLLAIALRTPVGITADVQAQTIRVPDGVTATSESLAIMEAVSAIRDVAGALDGVAASNRAIAEAVEGLDLSVVVE